MGWLIPKLSVFGVDEKSKVRDEVETAVKSMKQEDVAILLEFIRNGNMVARR